MGRISDNKLFWFFEPHLQDVEKTSFILTPNLARKLPSLTR